MEMAQDCMASRHIVLLQGDSDTPATCLRLAIDIDKPTAVRRTAFGSRIGLLEAIVGATDRWRPEGTTSRWSMLDNWRLARVTKSGGASPQLLDAPVQNPSQRCSSSSSIQRLDGVSGDSEMVSIRQHQQTLAWISSGATNLGPTHGSQGASLRAPPSQE